MALEQILQQEIKDTQDWLSREKHESIYKRDLKKEIELINWVLENMKKPDIQICSATESKLNEIHYITQHDAHKRVYRKI